MRECIKFWLKFVTILGVLSFLMSLMSLIFIVGVSLCTTVINQCTINLEEGIKEIKEQKYELDYTTVDDCNF